ncbi:MAG: RidA family protein [Candidatus Latescibacteria bacterium]|nr:RidA family protein [Candidatus Latescibacterota bacterium]
MSAEQRLIQMGLTLPEPPQPAGAYVRARRSGDIIYVAGQIPTVDGEVRYSGKVGADLTLEEGYEAAKLCGLNALAVLRAEAGSLNNIAQLVRVAGFVCSADGFTDQPKVINGASELFAEVLGEAGRHARVAVGVNELPLGSAVEVEVMAEVR